MGGNCVGGSGGSGFFLNNPNKAEGSLGLTLK